MAMGHSRGRIRQSGLLALSKQVMHERGAFLRGQIHTSSPHRQWLGPSLTPASWARNSTASNDMAEGADGSARVIMAMENGVANIHECCLWRNMPNSYCALIGGAMHSAEDSICALRLPHRSNMLPGIQRDKTRRPGPKKGHRQGDIYPQRPPLFSQMSSRGTRKGAAHGRSLRRRDIVPEGSRRSVEEETPRRRPPSRTSDLSPWYTPLARVGGERRRRRMCSSLP